MAAMGSAAADYMAVITMAVKVRDLFVWLLPLGLEIRVFPQFFVPEFLARS